MKTLALSSFNVINPRSSNPTRDLSVRFHVPRTQDPFEFREGKCVERQPMRVAMS